MSRVYTVEQQTTPLVAVARAVDGSLLTGGEAGGAAEATLIDPDGNETDLSITYSNVLIDPPAKDGLWIPAIHPLGYNFRYDVDGALLVGHEIFTVDIALKQQSGEITRLVFELAVRRAKQESFS